VTLGGWPSFPPALLKSLLEAAPGGSRFRLSLLGGAGLLVARIVRQDETGLVVETAEGTLAAVPWHAVARVETVRGDAGNPVGFRAG
jgi:hypothetical protein